MKIIKEEKDRNMSEEERDMENILQIIVKM